jgi:hypothetical protein
MRGTATRRPNRGESHHGGANPYHGLICVCTRTSDAPLNSSESAGRMLRTAPQSLAANSQGLLPTPKAMCEYADERIDSR